MGNKITEEIVPEIINQNYRTHTPTHDTQPYSSYNTDDIKITIHKASERVIPQSEVSEESSIDDWDSEAMTSQVEEIKDRFCKKKISGQSTNIELTNLEEDQEEMKDYTAVKRVKKFRCSDKF